MWREKMYVDISAITIHEIQKNKFHKSAFFFLQIYFYLEFGFCYL